MNKGLKTLTWWGMHGDNLPEPQGAFDTWVKLKARRSQFACPNPNPLDSQRKPCGAKLLELEGPVPCGSYNIRRWMVCEVCGWKGDRELGNVILKRVD